MKKIPQLQLNEPGTSLYSDFYGSTADQIALVELYGMSLMPINGLMKRRLYSLNLAEKIRDEWWLRPYDTGDAVLKHPNGNVKFLLDAMGTLKTSPESSLASNSLILPNSVYEQARGLELKAEDAAKINGIPITAETLADNPILLLVMMFLARGDQKLVMDYISAVHNYQGRSRGFETSMAIHLPKHGTIPAMMLLYMEGIANMSSISASELDNELNRVIGVESRSLEAPRRAYDQTTLEQKLVEVRRQFSHNAFERAFPQHF